MALVTFELGLSAQMMTLGEMTTIAGMISSPNRLNPLQPSRPRPHPAQ
jgi:membrane peptidoglycan carboxypeptidase